MNLEEFQRAVMLASVLFALGTVAPRLANPLSATPKPHWSVTAAMCAWSTAMATWVCIDPIDPRWAPPMGLLFLAMSIGCDVGLVYIEMTRRKVTRLQKQEDDVLRKHRK